MQWLDTELRDTRGTWRVRKHALSGRARKRSWRETTAQMNQLLADRSVCLSCGRDRRRLKRTVWGI